MNPQKRNYYGAFRYVGFSGCSVFGIEIQAFGV